MGCCGDREKLADVKPAQKWDYINLSDFKTSSCFTHFSYGLLYVFLVISVVCYVLDLFTLINLLRYDKWASTISSKNTIIDYSIARWIFLGCILFSWVLLVYRWYRAIMAMRSAVVVKSYLDPLAVRIESIRLGARGRGWRRFLIFAELTSHKKGSEYIALYVYFAFDAWLRVIVAQGPRAVINGLTLYSITKEDFLKPAASGGRSPFSQFFSNVRTVADLNPWQAAIFCGMLLTILVWVITFLGLVIAAVLYVVFLWHHIPSQDGGLRGFCKRKADKSLAKIVGKKIQKALDTQDFQFTKGSMKRQPTLPIFGFADAESVSEGSMLSRQTTQATLPPYVARAPTDIGEPISGLSRQPTLPDVSVGHPRPPHPVRTNTVFSDRCFASDQPLLSSLGTMGYGPPGRSYAPVPSSRANSECATMSDRPYPAQAPLAAYTTGPAPQQPQGRLPGYTLGGFCPSDARSPEGDWHGQITPLNDDTTLRPSPAFPLREQSQPPSDHATDSPFAPGLVSRDGVEYPSNARLAPGLPARSEPNMNGYQANTRNAPSTFAQARQNSALTVGTDPYSRRAPSGHMSRRAPIEEFSIEPQTLQTVEPPNHAGNRYQAYNPHLTRPVESPAPREFVPTMGPRNFSAPIRNAKEQDYVGQPAPLQRAGTAPLRPVATYDRSSHESYDEDAHWYPRSAMPRRAATAGPTGGRRV